MPDCYIGLMSGTSLDGIDAVLVEFDAQDSPRLLATHAQPLPPALHSELQRMSAPAPHLTWHHIGHIRQWLGEAYATAARIVMTQAGLEPADITAIGNHGQTVWHAPDAQRPFSIQLDAPARIAASTGCTVVADFRNNDMAIGGQGAPLVPAFHRRVFARADAARIVVNIGGIANLTILPCGADRDESQVRGLDTGPGNCLMDAWIQTHLAQAMDANGRWAASGTVDTRLLDALLQEPYLDRPAPKSTGREHFNIDWLRHHLATHQLAAVDVQATLCEYTARTIADGIDRFGPGHEDILVCGGGCHNQHLMTRLSELLSPRAVTSTARYGLAPDWVEATAFAWLAKRRMENLPGNLPAVTGARQPAILGGIHAPPVRPN